MRPAPLVVCLVLLAGCSGGGGEAAEAPTGGASTGTASSSSSSTAPPPPPIPDGPFEMAGTGCLELLVIVALTEEEARRFVPASYPLLGGASGQASGFAALKECADVALDGLSIGPASTSDVGVFIDKGEPGVFHYYQAWWTTDNPALWERLAAQGWSGGLSNDTLSAPVAGAAVGDLAASVASQTASYNLSAQVALADAPGDNRAVGWFDAPDGTVTVDKTLHGTRLGSGRGEVTGEGDALRLFGFGTSRGAALWNEYSMDAVVG